MVARWAHNPKVASSSLAPATIKPGKSRVFLFHPIMEWHFVYVIYAPKYDKIYIGYSSNPANRFLAHNHPENKGSTKKYQPWVLVHIEKFNCKQEAMQREQQLKSHKGRDFIRELINDIFL